MYHFIDRFPMTLLLDQSKVLSPQDARFCLVISNTTTSPPSDGFWMQTFAPDSVEDDSRLRLLPNCVVDVAYI